MYDARGHLIEPHTERNVPLGTLAVSFRQACMNRFEACGIVGNGHGTPWRMADEHEEETQTSHPTGKPSAAIRGLAWDSHGTLADSRAVVGRGGEDGRHVRASPQGEAVQRRGLRDDQGAGRVVRPSDRSAQRQEHLAPSPAEDALRRQHRKDRRGDWRPCGLRGSVVGH